jgi:hypothetical protein
VIRAVVASLCVLALASGCSFLLDGPPSPNRPTQPPRCDGSGGAPLFDSIFAAGAAAGSVALLITPSVACSSSDHNCHELDGPFYLGGLLLLIPTAVYTGAAAVGFDKTCRCRAAIAQYDRHRLRTRPMNRRPP